MCTKSEKVESVWTWKLNCRWSIKFADFVFKEFVEMLCWVSASDYLPLVILFFYSTFLAISKTWIPLLSCTRFWSYKFAKETSVSEKEQVVLKYFIFTWRNLYIKIFHFFPPLVQMLTSTFFRKWILFCLNCDGSPKEHWVSLNIEGARSVLQRAAL